MVQRIKILDSPNFTQQVTLSGNSYILSFKFNASDSNWYIDVDTPTEQNIYAGLRVVPNQNLTLPRQYNGRMPGGSLWCFREQRDATPVNRDNLGIDKAYEIQWLTDAEMEALGISGTIQL